MSIRKVLATVLIAAVPFAAGSAVAPASDRADLNKEIAAKFVEETLEKGNLDAMIDAHLSPDVEVEYPAGFKLPVLGTNKFKGADKVKLAGKAWKSETAHDVDVVEVVGEGDKVAVLINMDRVFLMEDGKKVYKDHAAAYFFTFKDGKIVKIVSVFDVLPEVEQVKAKKYGF